MRGVIDGVDSGFRAVAFIEWDAAALREAMGVCREGEWCDESLVVRVMAGAGLRGLMVRVLEDGEAALCVADAYDDGETALAAARAGLGVCLHPDNPVTRVVLAVEPAASARSWAVIW